MAVAQPKGLKPDPAPLWLPRHEAIVVDQSASRPPDVVDGYGLQDRLATILLGSRWKAVTSAAMVLSIILFLATMPSLFGAGVGALIKLSIYHSWTLGLLLIATSRVRSITIGSVLRYWIAGFFVVFMATHFATKPLGAGGASAWIAPLLYVLVCVFVLAAALYLGRRIWRQPGLSDLVVLGFALGAGYEFHAAGAWEAVAASGFKANAGLFAPSIVQSNGLFTVGPAVWTSMLGLVLGLVVLHRYQAFAAVAAVFGLAVLLADLLSLHLAPSESAPFLRQLVFNGRLLGLLCIAGVAAAVVLDHRRLGSTADRDHLFPSDHSYGARVVIDEGRGDDVLKPLLAGRYRRLRNGMYNTVEATARQWPPRSESYPAPLAELARLGRAADIAVGPGTSSSGWAADPESIDGHRFVGPLGFTTYVAGVEGSTATVTSPAVVIDDAAASLGGDYTSVSLSTPKARVEAAGLAERERTGDYWQYVGLGAVAVALFGVVRLLTAGDPTVLESIGTGDVAGLGDTSPAVIRGLLGAVVAAVALRGRNAAVVGPGSEVGPGNDPQPTHPAECEA